MPTKSKKILIIEDEKPMARALGLKLGRAGFETKIVFDGESGLAELKKEKFDLIVCDLIMPRMNGFQVLDEIRGKKILTPIIVLTNLGQKEDEEKARSLGAREFIIKSNTPIADVVERIKNILK